MATSFKILLSYVLDLLLPNRIPKSQKMERFSCFQFGAYLQVSLKRNGILTWKKPLLPIQPKSESLV